VLVDEQGTIQFRRKGQDTFALIPLRDEGEDIEEWKVFFDRSGTTVNAACMEFDGRPCVCVNLTRGIGLGDVPQRLSSTVRLIASATEEHQTYLSELDEKLEPPENSALRWWTQNFPSATIAP